MSPSERNTPQQIQGIVRMVFELTEGMGLVPDEDDFYAAISDWLRTGKTPSTVSLGYWEEGTNTTIDTVMKAEAELNLIKGDYILATKWHDGDPQDAWCIGYFSHMLDHKDVDQARFIVVDENGKPFRANGYRKAERITKERGVWMLANVQMIEQSDLPLWNYWVTFDYEKEK